MPGPGRTVERNSSPRIASFGRYDLITPIGRGGMAEVHLAIQRGPAGFEKLVVIKIIHGHLQSQPAFVEMLLDEARLAALVKHPNVVDIYDLGEANARNYVAMEYLEGEPLLAVLRAGSEGRRLDPLSTARIIADTAEGLDAAHRLKGRDGTPIELVHHDVSLGNIVVLYTGQVKLVDFGVAKAAQAGKDQRVQGKFAYMAPEKLEHGAGDRRCDIWSLGVVAYEALTLTRLFRGTSLQETVQQVTTMTIAPPSQVNGDVPKDFDPIILKALDRDPAKRYQTAKAFGDDLEEVLREHKYGGKNDRIAAYMQGTFEKTIAAREELLREVLGDGRPSVAVVEAAFPETVVVVEQTITSTSASGELETATVTVNEAIPRRADPSWATGPQAVSLQQLQKWVEARRNRRRPMPSWLPYAGGAVVLLVVMLLATSGDPNVAASAVATVPSDAQIAHEPAPIDAPEAAPVVVDAGAPSEPEEIEMGGQTVRKPAPPSGPRPPPTQRPKLKADAASLYAQAMQLLRSGDAKGALAALEQARRQEPSYAPIWYGIGLVYEELGQRGQAKAAYQRYLSLSPRAANADQVRARIQRL